MCERVVDAVAATSGDYTGVGLPEIGGQASLNTPSLFGGAWVMLEIASDLTEHGASIEQALLFAIGEKVEQSISGGWDPDTVLLLDLSRLGLSWVRPDNVWAGRLEAMALDWSALPFAAVAVVFSTLTDVGYHGACVSRPGLPNARAAAVGQLLRYMGFDL